MDITAAISEAMHRDHDLASCGFVKNRRIRMVRDFGPVASVAATYGNLKRRYKSAFFRRHLPPKELMIRAYNAPSPFMKLLNRETR